MLKKKFYSIDAQTAIELVVFGAVILFLLGTMIRYGLNAGSSQNQNLRAMRMAMTKSFVSAEVGKNALSKHPGNSSRNVATVVLIEDRIAADPSKFGVQSRTPFVTSASATFSKNLFMPLDYGEYDSIPRMDFVINGDHFELTTAGFKEYQLAPQSAPVPIDLDDGNSDSRWANDWNPDCDKKGTGCRVVYSLSPNMLANDVWNYPPVGDQCVNPFRSCFDLTRDGLSIVPVDLRSEIAWQWLRVNATTLEIDLENGKNLIVDVDGDFKEEQVLEMTDVYGTRYTPYKTKKRKRTPTIPIQSVKVLDYQAGDIDLTHNRKSVGTKPGLFDDIQGYTFSREGTYLQIDEGQLLGPNQSARSTQKRNIVDIYQRGIQLSNDTGFICGNGTKEPWDAPDHEVNPQWSINPETKKPSVEVCVPPGAGAESNCFAAANVYRTCFDEGTKILYVRSRIHEKRGRKWFTDLGPRG